MTGFPIEIMMVNIGHHSWEVVMSYDINQDGIYHCVIQNIIFGEYGNGGDVSWNENWKVLDVQQLELSIGEQISFTHSNCKL
jgi:hypothetical protein